MKYLVLFYANPANWAHPTFAYHTSVTSEEARQRLLAADDAAMKPFHESGEIVEGTPLAAPATARTIRRRGRKPVVTEGPFIESREQFAGFYLLECESMERAVEIVSAMPGLEHDVAEIRAVYDWNEQP